MAVGEFFIYADESGTMPLDDHDKPFVGAVVGAAHPILAGGDLMLSQQRLIGHLRTEQTTPSVCHVIPHAGFGELVRTKFSKMNTMARARRLVTRQHAYLPADGFSARNLIWGHCVTQAVGQILRAHVFTSPVSSLEIVLDEKTLAAGERDLFTDECRKIPERLLDALNRLRHFDPSKIDLALAHMRLTPATVKVRWSDDPTVSGAEHGLRLADRLAWHHRKHLLKPTKPSFHEVLAEAGWPGDVIDVTPLVTMPLHPEAIEEWKRDTGLPEPLF